MSQEDNKLINDYLDQIWGKQAVDHSPGSSQYYSQGQQQSGSCLTKEEENVRDVQISAECNPLYHESKDGGFSSTQPTFGQAEKDTTGLTRSETFDYRWW